MLFWCRCVVGRNSDRAVVAVGECTTDRRLDLGDDYVSNLCALVEAYNNGGGGEAEVSELVEGQTLLRNMRSSFFN